MLVVSGILKEDVREKFKLSTSQLNKILKEANEEAEQWFHSLPRQTMIQIFRFNSEKIFGEIQILEQIRNKEKEPARQFEMTKGIMKTSY